MWAQLGQELNGESLEDRFGNSVSLSSDGNVVAIGAPHNNNRTGLAKVYKNDGNSWIQLGNTFYGNTNYNYFAHAVSLNNDGTILAIGAYNYNNNKSGYVKVFEYNNNIWNQLGKNIDGKLSGDNFGNSVSISSDGTRVAIGAYNRNNNKSGYVNINEFTNYNEIENLYVSNELKFKENNEIKSINDKANLESPVFTGSPEVPTQTVENNNKIVNNTMLIESVNNINGSIISNSTINNTTLKGNVNYEDSVGNVNPMLYLNINEVSENTTIPINSSGIYVNTSGNSIDLILDSDSNKNKTLTGYSSMLVYTSSSEIYGFASVSSPVQPTV